MNCLQNRKPSKMLSHTELLLEVDQFILEAKETLRKEGIVGADIKCTQATNEVEKIITGCLETA